MKVAITGASGHIGNCLVRELIKEGAEIKALIHNRRNDLDKMEIQIVEGSLLDQGSLLNLCRGADVVFHLAARISVGNKSAEKVYDSNVTGTRNILRASLEAGVRKFIHFSSIHAFDAESREAILDENTPLVHTNNNIYEFTKAEGEREVIKAVMEGLDAVILNPTAVIGPFDYNGSLLGRALVKIYKNELPFLVSGGYNWVDVRDIASAALKAVESGRKGERYILSGKFCTLRELCGMINKISGCRIPWIVPDTLARLACPFLSVYSSIARTEPLYTFHTLDILNNSPVNISCAKARKELAYETRPLEQTLRDTFNWYKANNVIS